MGRKLKVSMPLFQHVLVSLSCLLFMHELLVRIFFVLFAWPRFHSAQSNAKCSTAQEIIRNVETINKTRRIEVRLKLQMIIIKQDNHDFFQLTACCGIINFFKSVQVSYQVRSFVKKHQICRRCD